jgi:hypothetical protein
MGPVGEARCYCLKRVNPFEGVVAVVKTRGGRALSIDGLRWQIQVLAHPPSGLWSRGGERTELRYFRFGFWSEEDGFSRVPLSPMLDTSLMIQESEELITAVRAHADALPFPLAPELERWLLNPEGEPLALIATALLDTELGDLPCIDWSAGGRGEGRPFVSARLTAQGVPQREASGRLRHVESIERLIAEAAGAPRMSQWFRLDPEGALGLAEGAPAGLAGRRLPLGALPVLTLRTRWPREADSALVQEYLSWLSPYLLTLPGLSDEERQGLESAAVRHAPALDALWRLYPRILDPDLIRRARVEARLRRVAA